MRSYSVEKSYPDRNTYSHSIDFLPVRPDAKRPEKDILLLRATETEDRRNFVFPRRRRTFVLEMALHWILRGGIWVLELV